MAPRTVIDGALAWYPGWWRDCYEPEVRATIEPLLAEGRSPGRIAFGLVRGALRTRFFARGLPLTYAHYAKRARLSIAAATIPWIVITPVLLALTGQFTLHSNAGPVSEGYPFEPWGYRTTVYDTATFHPFHASMSTATWILGWMTSAIGVLFLITLAVLATGLRTFRSSLPPGECGRGRLLRFYTWTPFITVIALVVLSLADDVLFGPRSALYSHGGVAIMVGGHPALAEATGDLRWIVALVGWVVSVVGLSIAASQADLPPASLRYGRTVSILTACSISLSFVALVTWSLAYRAQDGQRTLGAAVTVTYPHHAWWFAVAPLVVAATALAQWGAYSAQRSWRIINSRDLWRTYRPED